MCHEVESALLNQDYDYYTMYIVPQSTDAQSLARGTL